MAVDQWFTVCLIWTGFLGVIMAQNQIYPPSQQQTFYMNKASDCDGKIRSTGSNTVYIFGKTSEIQAEAGRVLSCTITLDTEDQREPRRFKIQFLAVTIRDPNVHLIIYDGEFDGRQLHAFSSNKQLPQDLDFDFTSGQRVSFRLVRGELDTNFDIRLVAIPVPADVQRCTYENEYGCDEYGYNYRILGTKEIAGIIAGGFALVVIVVVIIVICCYRKQRGISQKWKQEKLGSVNTAASIHSLNGKVNKDTNMSKPWTSESSKAEFASIRRSPKLPRVSVTRHANTADRDRDKDSAFGSNESFHRQRQPLPTHDRSLPRNTRHDTRDYRDRDRRDRDYRDRDYDRESDRSDRSDRQVKRYKPPTYREAMKRDHDTSGSEFDATEHSFVQADDDHPQKTFIERVITPRVRPKKEASPLQQKRVLPLPEDDLTYDSIEPKKSKIAETQKDEGDTEESDTSNTDNESEESEEETDSEADAAPGKGDKPDAKEMYSKVNKNKGVDPPAGGEGAVPQNPGFMPPQQVFMQGQGYPGYFPPGVHQPQPRYGYPMQQVPAYQNHFLPPGPGMQPQPLGPRPDLYSQANFTVPMNQPGSLPQQHQPHHSKQRDNKPAMSQQPNNPPIYSYLVNRGYQPLDGRHSPISTSTGASNLSGDKNLGVEDSDFSANLGSGVELMKRKA